jgi:2-C-methyl-D-erythritol 4-phosphate cytidylyltransferase
VTGRIGVVVVAAGSGTRLGSDGPKALTRVAGRSLLAHTLAGLAAAGLPPAVVVYAPDARAAFELAAEGIAVGAYVPGGATRTDSVRAGVAALPTDVEVVAVHDAARPLTPPDVVRAAVAAVTDPDGPDEVVGAAPAIPVADTLKRVEGDVVRATVDRSALVGVQTPQVFRRAVLELALRGPEQATDDLGLVEQLVASGRVEGRVVVVPGSAWGRKVTFASDLAVVEALAATAPSDTHPSPVTGTR